MLVFFTNKRDARSVPALSIVVNYKTPACSVSIYKTLHLNIYILQETYINPLELDCSEYSQPFEFKTLLDHNGIPNEFLSQT